MPYDDIVVRQDVLEKGNFGANDRVVITKHIAAADPDGGIAEDLLKEYDIWAAGKVMAELEQLYPGHCWRVIHDSFHGMCLISIPILMGVNKYMAVNLKTHSLDSERVRLAGGEILERYGLRRGRFQLDPFLDAREKHSRLVVQSRQVPE